MIYLILVFQLISASQQNTQETLLGTVYLDAASKTLMPESDTILHDIRDTLSNSLNLMINIYGYAHTAGSAAANTTLSQELADQVRDYLTVKLGIAGDRIQTLGVGSKDGLSSNSRTKDKIKKPRVEIVIRQPDAVLTRFENDVKVQPPALRPDWLNPVPNYYLYRGYKVATGKKSHAHILYQNNSMIRIDENALIIIQGLNLPQKEDSIIKNIEVQEGGLNAILEDATSPDNSSTELSSPLSDSILENRIAFVDEKMEDLIVAYQSSTDSPRADQKTFIDSSESVDNDQDIAVYIPDGFGLGIVIGEPTGISVKKRIDTRSAFDFSIGWSFPGERIHIAVDYLSHFPPLLDKRNLSPYLAIGGRLKMKAEQQEKQFIFGIRFGGGIEYVSGQFGLYCELFPVVDMIPETKFGLEGGIGARYYFRD